MSKLQKMLQKITQVIVSYYETQISHSYSLESYSNKSHEELQEFLQSLIDEATKKWPTRRSLLQYFLFVIDTIKPLADKKSPMTQDEEDLVLNTLVLLLTTCRHLLSASQSETVNAKYGETITPIPGFVRGFAKGYSFCNTGQLINSVLFEPLKITKDTDIQEMIKELISRHQAPLLETDKLVKEIDLKNTTISLLQEENNRLSSQLSTASNQHETEQQIKTALLEEKGSAVDECEKLKAELKTETTKIDTLTKGCALQEAQIISLQDKNTLLLSQLTTRNSQYEHDQQQKILMLKEKATLFQEYENLKTAFQAEKTEMVRLQGENKRLLEQQSIIKNQLDTALQKIEENTTEINQMQEQNSKMNSTAVQLGLLRGTTFGNFGLKGNFFTQKTFIAADNPDTNTTDDPTIAEDAPGSSLSYSSID